MGRGVCLCIIVRKMRERSRECGGHEANRTVFAARAPNSYTPFTRVKKMVHFTAFKNIYNLTLNKMFLKAS